MSSTSKFKYFDRCVDHALTTWRKDQPVEAAMFLSHHMREIHDMRPRTVVGNSQTYRHTGEVPSYVSGMIDLYFPRWLNDKNHRDRFFRRFACFRATEGKFLGTKQASDETTHFKAGEEGVEIKTW